MTGQGIAAIEDIAEDRAAVALHFPAQLVRTAGDWFEAPQFRLHPRYQEVLHEPGTGKRFLAVGGLEGALLSADKFGLPDQRAIPGSHCFNKS